MSQKIAILGAGIAGISAAYHAQQKYPNDEVVIYEKESFWGGLCGGFELDSILGKFWFDHFVHLSFASDPYVKDNFNRSATPILHTPDPINYYKNIQIKHPAQNNLYPLDPEIKVKIIKDMLKNVYEIPTEKREAKNFEQWLKFQYGDYFAEHFPMAYTRKYWTTEAKNLSVSWVGDRLYRPNIEEILYGAMSNNTPCTYYAKEQRYPKCGQYRSFFKLFANQCHILYNYEVSSIDMESKTLTFKTGDSKHFDKIISTLPLPSLPNLIVQCPKNIQEAKKDLFATSGAIVSLGFNKKIAVKNLWFYIYDEDILPSRVYSPSNKSPANAPKNCSSLQAEIYFSPLKPINALDSKLKKLSEEQIKKFFLEHTIEKFIKMGLCKESDIIAKDVRILPYANVIFTHQMEEKRQIIADYLSSIGLLSCGRFGEWDYFWSDQSFLSGKKAGQAI